MRTEIKATEKNSIIHEPNTKEINIKYVIRRTFNFSYMTGDSLVLFKFRFFKLVSMTNEDKPASVTGVSQRFRDSNIGRCSASICKPLSPNYKGKKELENLLIDRKRVYGFKSFTH